MSPSCLFCMLSLLFSAVASAAPYVDLRLVITRVKRDFELLTVDSRKPKQHESVLIQKTTSEQEVVKRLQDLMTHQTVLRISEDTRLKTLLSSRKQGDQTISIARLKEILKPKERIKQRMEVRRGMLLPPKEH